MFATAAAAASAIGKKAVMKIRKIAGTSPTPNHMIANGIHAIGESVSEMLDWVPAQLRVVRISRPKYACRACNKVVQAPAPERLIAGGLATPALLAQVLVSKYCDHLPLYRQQSIFRNRYRVHLPRQSMARWMGLAADWLRPIYEEIRTGVMAGGYLQIDETPIRYLSPQLCASSSAKGDQGRAGKKGEAYS